MNLSEPQFPQLSKIELVLRPLPALKKAISIDSPCTLALMRLEEVQLTSSVANPVGTCGLPACRACLPRQLRMSLLAPGPELSQVPGRESEPGTGAGGRGQVCPKG